MELFGLKKRKFKDICHLLRQSVSKSQTLVFLACKMPAMQIHYRRILVQLHIMPDSAGLMTRIFLEKKVELFNDSIYPLVSWDIPLNLCILSLLNSLTLICIFLSVCALAYAFAICWPIIGSFHNNLTDDSDSSSS